MKPIVKVIYINMLSNDVFGLIYRDLLLKAYREVEEGRETSPEVAELLRIWMGFGWSNTGS